MTFHCSLSCGVDVGLTLGLWSMDWPPIRPAWWPLDCVWPWLLSLELTDLHFGLLRWCALSSQMIWVLGWPWLPSPHLAAGLPYVLWCGEPCPADWLILYSSSCRELPALPDPWPWEVSMENWFFGKTHLGVKHFLYYQHSTARACGLGDILSAHWGRWHCVSKLCLPSHLQCGKCVITSSLVAKLISIPTMGCDVFLNSAGWPSRSFCPASGKDVWGFGGLFLVSFSSC